MKQYPIFPECYIDTNLIGYLIGGQVMHKHTCNEVAKAVNKANGFAIGVIDADKRLATMDSGFRKFEQSNDADGKTKHVTMFVHDDGKRFVFTVKPAMDKFIFDAVNEQRINMALIGYSTDFDEFKKETKRIQAANDSKFRKLFDLIGNNWEMRNFRNTLKYLIHEQMDADAEIAKQFFDGKLDADDLKVFFVPET